MGPPVGQRSEKEECKAVGSPELLESDLGSDVHHFGIIELLGESIKSSPSTPPPSCTHVHTQAEGIAQACDYQEAGLTGSH